MIQVRFNPHYWKIAQFGIEHINESRITKIELTKLLDQAKKGLVSCRKYLEKIETDEYQAEDYTSDLTAESYLSTCEEIARLDKVINILTSYLQPRQKEPKILKEAISLFCNYVAASIKPRKYKEKAEDYCREVCEMFDLSYSDKVRQGFVGKPKDPVRGDKRIRKIVCELIIPNITNPEHKAKLQKYLQDLPEKL